MPIWLLSLINIVLGYLGFSKKKAEEKRLEEMNKDKVLDDAIDKAIKDDSMSDLNKLI